MDTLSSNSSAVEISDLKRDSYNSREILEQSPRSNNEAPPDKHQISQQLQPEPVYKTRTLDLSQHHLKDGQSVASNQADNSGFLLHNFHILRQHIDPLNNNETQLAKNRHFPQIAANNTFMPQRPEQSTIHPATNEIACQDSSQKLQKTSPSSQSHPMSNSYVQLEHDSLPSEHDTIGKQTSLVPNVPVNGGAHADQTRQYVVREPIELTCSYNAHSTRHPVSLSQNGNINESHHDNRQPEMQELNNLRDCIRTSEASDQPREHRKSEDFATSFQGKNCNTSHAEQLQEGQEVPFQRVIEHKGKCKQHQETCNKLTKIEQGHSFNKERQETHDLQHSNFLKGEAAAEHPLPEFGHSKKSVIAQEVDEKQPNKKLEHAAGEIPVLPETYHTEKHDNGSAEANRLRLQLSRLRAHMIRTEEEYTNQILQADKRLEDLQAAHESSLEQRIHIENNLSSELKQVHEQLSALQLQYMSAIRDRDKAEQEIAKLSQSLNEECEKTRRLQAVLASFDDEKTAAVQTTIKKHAQELSSRDQELVSIRKQLVESKLYISQMEQQIEQDQKQLANQHVHQGMVTSLQAENTRLKEHVSYLHGETEAAKTKTEALQIDKTLLQNAVTQFFTTDNSAMKTEVMRVIADICEFSYDMKVKAGLLPRPRSGVFGLFASSEATYSHPNITISPSSSTSFTAYNKQNKPQMQEQVAGREEASLSHQFVNFLMKDVSSSTM
eukprot:gene3042-5823_t